MRLLLTSDWQVEFSNLDYAEISLQELLKLASKIKPAAIVHLGDLKEDYNPIDLRVVKFWVRAVTAIRAAGHRFIALMGNHDRISQSRESKNWLDVLRAAGAETISQPRVKEIESRPIAFLPYTGDKEQEKQWASEVLDMANDKVTDFPPILMFHTGIHGAMLDSGRKECGNLPEDLFMPEYQFCFGGHLHTHQLVTGNVLYVGSPWCQSWGEANAQKGHVEVKIEGIDWKSVTIIRHITKIPHWYDTEYLESRGVEPEPGAYVRSRITVAAKGITQQMRDEEARMHNAFPASKDLRFFVVPKIQQPEKLEVALSGESDKAVVEQYVAATLQESSRFTAEQGVAYMVTRLKGTPPRPVSARIRYISATATNTLSFKRVEVKYEKQGLVLLKGQNLDWPKRSNGVGKTNLLSLLLVAKYGKTLKEQKADEWAREQATGRAEVRLLFQDGKKRTVEVIRGRPHRLIMEIDGTDVSTGIRGIGKQETQGQIEEITGYDFHTDINAVYIDQTIANGFVFGTQKDRMDLVGKLQNLERFEAALKLVRADIKANQEAVVKTTANLESLEEERDRLEQELAELLLPPDSGKWAKAAQAARKELRRLAGVKSALAGVEATYQEYQADIDELLADQETLANNLDDVMAESASRKKQLDTAQMLIKKQRCPVCQRPSVTVGQDWEEKATAGLEKAKKSIQKLRDSLGTVKHSIGLKQGKIQIYREQVLEAQTELDAQRKILKQAEEMEREETGRNQKLQIKQEKIKTQITKVKRCIKAARVVIKDLDIQTELYQYALKAFQRNGIPMYLSAAMCPRLNAAADEYSDLFWDGRIRVNFHVTDGEFKADIVNPNGSQKPKGQSVGESAMAGITAAFAVRETAPGTNLLIMDEPGHGLDPEGARQFAKGLLRLKDRFETIIVTTHNPIIESVLAGEKIWTVQKKHGISRLITD